MISLGIFSRDPLFRHPDDLARLREHFEVHDFGDHKGLKDEDVAEKCRTVEVVLLGKSSPKLTEHLVIDPGKLRYALSVRGSIKPYVDRRLLESGLVATNWGDSQATVAEGTMTLLLGLLRQAPALDHLSRTGEDLRVWQAYPCKLEGLNVGVYGLGGIGRRVARLLQAFEAQVAFYDPFAKDVPQGLRACSTLHELFSSCQAISIHCGLTESTRATVTRELLELLPQGAVLVNTARGAVVDEPALTEFVREGRLLAGLDVIENENDWRSSPLAALPGAWLTRHMVSGSKGYPPGKEPVPGLPQFAWTNLENYRLGRPLVNLITTKEFDLMT